MAAVELEVGAVQFRQHARSRRRPRGRRRLDKVTATRIVGSRPEASSAWLTGGGASVSG